MMAVVEFIADNPVMSTFLAMVALISFVLTYISTPQKKMKVIISDTELINNKQSELQKLSIYYDGKSVEKLSVTKITLWNAAFPPIRRTDIANSAPIVISTSEDEILDVSVLKGDNTANKISIKKTNASPYCIDFEYLNRKEGGIIQVVHTGAFKSINVTEALIGGKIKIFKNPKTNTLKVVVESLATTMLSGIFSVLVLVLILYVGVPEHIAAIIFGGSLFGMITILLFLQSKEFIPRNCKSNSAS